jgi:hypothetical protein
MEYRKHKGSILSGALTLYLDSSSPYLFGIHFEGSQADTSHLAGSQALAAQHGSCASFVTISPNRLMAKALMTLLADAMATGATFFTSLDAEDDMDLVSSCLSLDTLQVAF